jgi:hypothetical protein
MFWHYTSANHYVSIVNDGMIMPATTYVPVGERPIVWFSTEQFWEPTAAKACHRPDGTRHLLTLDGMLEQDILPIRIGVDSTVAPYRWSDLKSLSGMSSETARSLASSGKRMGANPSRWRGTFEVVRAKEWRTIDYYNGLEWVPLEWKGATSRAAREGTDESSTMLPVSSYESVGS